MATLRRRAMAAHQGVPDTTTRRTIMMIITYAIAVAMIWVIVLTALISVRAVFEEERR